MFFSEPLPCDDGRSLRWYRAQHRVILTKILGLRIIFDKTGTFVSLLRNLSKNSAHRQNLTKLLVLCHKFVNFSQFLEKFKYRCVAIRLS
jgi:hypothetical protein